ncbi:hypothetical protein A3L12_07260 [Thermococcus sp. P6]|uniref:hypothetical protein n=1 Tax=Thermococcus sp. P6 TaxID=122420 RepID=UPI000B59E032|nr:hypothetical protein [Thermococcus sp. P6]ASJ11109.1 hypothetical protein A3L12_07260 [Thermococcus sp. P6]
MPRGMGRGYGGRYWTPGGFYGLLDLLILIGILYFLVKLLLVALPYALGLIILLMLRSFLRGPGFRGFF